MICTRQRIRHRPAITASSSFRLMQTSVFDALCHVSSLTSLHSSAPLTLSPDILRVLAYPAHSNSRSLTIKRVSSASCIPAQPFLPLYCPGLACGVVQFNPASDHQSLLFALGSSWESRADVGLSFWRMIGQNDQVAALVDFSGSS